MVRGADNIPSLTKMEYHHSKESKLLSEMGAVAVAVLDILHTAEVGGFLSLAASGSCFFALWRFRACAGRPSEGALRACPALLLDNPSVLLRVMRADLLSLLGVG